MPRIRSAVLALSALCSLLGLNTSPAAEWTFFVYLAADNSLSRAASDDLLEMQSVGSSADVNVVVLIDQRHDPDTRFYEILEDGSLSETPLSEISPEWGDELNLAKPAVLKKVSTYVVDTYPAEKFCLVLWNHGSGWHRSGRRPDYKAVLEDKGRMMRMDDVGRTLRAVASHRGSEIDLIGFDACLMGMVEVAYEIREAGRTMVASEELEPLDGWPYDTILAALKADPSAGHEALGAAIVEGYADGPPHAGEWTLSAARLDRMVELVTAIDDFADSVSSDWSAIQSARDGVQEFGTEEGLHDNIDLYDFAGRVGTPPALGVKSAIEEAIVHSRCGGQADRAYGLAIYFPANRSGYSDEYDDRDAHQIQFPVDSQWDEFLTRYYDADDDATLSGTVVDRRTEGPVKNAKVILKRKRPKPRTKHPQRTNQDGELAFTHLASGRYSLTVKKPGYRRHQEAFNLSDGEDKLIDVRLRRR